MVDLVSSIDIRARRFAPRGLFHALVLLLAFLVGILCGVTLMRALAQDTPTAGASVGCVRGVCIV